jgi:hypothetical protein
MAMTDRSSVRAVGSLIVVWIGVTLGPSLAAAQNVGVEIGGHVGVLRLSELDTTDVGVGIHAVAPLSRRVAIEGALTWFPGSSDEGLNRQGRSLGLAGVRATLGSGNVDFFARGRAGYLRFGDEGSVICIAVFPPPLSCRLAAGYTAFAADFGGGASIGIGSSGRLRVHIDAGDLLVRYAVETFRPAEGAVSEGFVGHNPLVSVGLGWRF